MGTVFLLIDGMASDHGALPGFFHTLAKQYAYGTALTCPKGVAAESVGCILTLLGVPAAYLPKGRAYVDALGSGVAMEENDLLLRCSLLSLDGEGKLLCATGGSLAPEEKQNMLRLAVPLFAQEGIRLTPTADYRGILRLEGQAHAEKRLCTFPPHRHGGEAFEHILPRGGAVGERLCRAAKKSREVLGGRFAVLPWGEGAKTMLPGFCSLHGKRAGAVTGTAAVRGLCLALSMDTPILPFATGDVDTDLRRKVETALFLLESNDVVFLHLGGADEAAHRRSPAEKATFFSRIEKEVLPVLLGRDITLLLCGDHSSLCQSGEHAGHPQPFVLKKHGVTGNLGVIGGRKLMTLCKEGR